MKRIVALTLAAMSLLIPVLTAVAADREPSKAMTSFDESFNTLASFERWSAMDKDGDGFCWEHSPENTAAVSFSVNGEAALVPDNWLVSPVLNSESTMLISFSVCSSSVNALQTYSVYLLKEGSDLIEEAVLIKSGLAPETMTTTCVQVNGGEFSTARLMIRHHDSEGGALYVGDISVYKSSKTNRLDAGYEGAEYKQRFFSVKESIPMPTVIGALPEGLSVLEQSDLFGITDYFLVGTPTVCGDYSFKFAAYTYTSPFPAAYQTVTLQIKPVTETLPLLKLNVSEYCYFDIVLDYEAMFEVVSGTVPSGMSVTSETSGAGETSFLLTGAPNRPGSYEFTVCYYQENRRDELVSITYTCEVAKHITHIPAACVTQQYSELLYSLESGSMSTIGITGRLPEGISVVPEGVVGGNVAYNLAGVPTETGRFEFTVTYYTAGESHYAHIESYYFCVVQTEHEFYSLREVYCEESLLTLPHEFEVQDAPSEDALPEGIVLDPYVYVDGDYVLYSYDLVGKALETGLFSFSVTFAYELAEGRKNTITVNVLLTIEGNELALEEGTQYIDYYAEIYETYYDDELELASGTMPEGIEIVQFGRDDMTVFALTGAPTQSGSFDFTINAVSPSFGSDDGIVAVIHCTLVIKENTLLGDVTIDGRVNTGDAVMILRYNAGLITLTDEQLALADFTKDGRVNTGDVVALLRYCTE